MQTDLEVAASPTATPPSQADERRTGWLGKDRWLVVIAATAVVLYYAVNAVHFGEMPLRIEENEWPPMAQAIIETGKPVITADETHRVRFTPDLQVDPSPLVGAWHPPLYQYTLAAAMLVMGDSASNALRIVGTLGLLASAALLLLIAREVTPRWRLIGGVAVGLLLIHPYAIQGSMFLDIDNTVYAPLALLAIWIAIRYSRREGLLRPQEVLVLGAAIALVTWAKMTTTIAFVGVLGVWWLLRRPWPRAPVEVVAFLGTGAALFAATYGLWCAVTGIPFSYTFDVTFAQKSNRLFGDSLLLDQAAHWHLRWFGAALLVISAVYLVDLIRSLVKTRRLREIDLPFLVGVGVLLNYIVVSPTDGTYQGKYAFVALAALLLPVSWMLLRDRGGEGSSVLWVAAVAVGGATAFLVPDRLTNLSLYSAYGTWTTEWAVVAGCAAAFSLVWLLGGRRGFAGGVLVVLAMLLVAQGVRSYQSDHSPMYPIPDTDDFRAAARDLNNSTDKGEIVVAPKDLGFYIDGPVVEGEDAFARGDTVLASAIEQYPAIVALARNSFGPPVGPATLAVVNRCFRDRKVFGSVTLEYRTSSCRP